uniref:Uncharacterized protein n=1 Tax=Tanacetum cinerariifolium TaxID=118510 RepID=A0A6L2MLT5_TANCI|nr:hypothetical protein [Tanacetum cinerariifolium]
MSGGGGGGGRLCGGDGEWHGGGVYIHAKPEVTGTYTDVVIWLYYPFNGPSKLKRGPFTIKLGKAGEHVSNWEHMRPVVYAALHDHARYNAPNSYVYYEADIQILTSELKNAYPIKSSSLNFKVVGPVDEAAKSDRVLDILATPSSYEIVSLDYGDGYVIPPPWLDYTGKLGPTINTLWKEEAKIAINLGLRN